MNAVEAAQRLARLGREVRVIRRTPLCVERDAPRFTVHVNEACEETRAANTKTFRPARSPAIADSWSMLGECAVHGARRETKRREGAGDNKEDCDRPHLQEDRQPVGQP